MRIPYTEQIIKSTFALPSCNEEYIGRKLFIFSLLEAHKCVPASWWLFVSVNELVRREKLHDNSAIRFSLSHEEAQKAGQLQSSRLHREHRTPTQSSTDRSGR